MHQGDNAFDSDEDCVADYGHSDAVEVVELERRRNETCCHVEETEAIPSNSTRAIAPCSDVRILGFRRSISPSSASKPGGARAPLRRL